MTKAAIGSGLLCLASPHAALAQATEPQVLPPIAVDSPGKPKSGSTKRTAQKRTAATRGTRTNPSAQPATDPAAGATTPAEAALDKKMQGFDASREHMLPKLGASTYTVDRAAIESMPQGDNTPVDKLVLQFPGVNYDSAASNPNFHVRGEYANVQTRINGFVLPEGVSGWSVIDTNFIGSISLLTGTLPAQYGGRTAGILDITSRAFSTPGGSVSIYGGSQNTITPSFDYGGSVGNTQYFFSGRGNFNDLGIENPTSSINALHDHTDQGKFFAYVSTAINDTQRVSVISGAAYSAFQIPNNPNQQVFPDSNGVLPNGLGATTLANAANSANSANLNEREIDQYYYNIVALQSHGELIDSQISVFSRYANVHFIPDVNNDLIFNGVASDVTRASQMYGTQFDASYDVNPAHTLRFGFMVTAEKTDVSNISTVFNVDPVTDNPTGAPFTINDTNSLLGWNIGTYVQDEWKLTNQLTLNYGMRFDQLYQFVNANQFSPRISLTYKPFDGTTFHAGYARYFTPPMQAQATQSNLALFNGTTNQPDVPNNDPVLPERSHYFDVGVDQKLFPGLVVGFDAYYKIATDLIDDGQFGQAVVLTQFNWARAYSEGAEAKVKYTNGNFSAYANLAFNITRATDPVSNQYLLDPDEFTFLLNNYHYTDDMQMWTGSAGAAYRWNENLFSVNMRYGSGLPTGFANSAFNQPYTTFNLGYAREIQTSIPSKPLTVRFDIVNLTDKIYELRDGSGIGVFAPQFGARRGYYVGLSQKL